MLVLAAVAALLVLAEEQPRRDEPNRSRLAESLLVREEAGGGLTGLTPAFGDVWANDYGREQLVRLDGRSGRVVARLRLGRRLALAAGEGSLWALRWGGNFFRRPNGPLYRIDPRTNRVIARIPLLSPGFGVLYSGGSVWVWGPDSVRRVHPQVGRAFADLRVHRRHGELTGAVAHAGGVLALHADGTLLRFGNRGDRTVTRAPALAGAELLAVAGSRAVAARAGTLLAVDTRTGRLLWRRALGFRVSTVLESGGVLLAQGARFRDPGDRLWALDPATGRIRATATVPSFGTTSMAASGDALWLATGAGEVIIVPPLLSRLFRAARAG
jgi:outer membrane protein assembly factor BamB